jgi:hypothetical protein
MMKFISLNSMTCGIIIKKNNRGKASVIYNAFKHLQSVKKLAVSDQIDDILKSLGFHKPALIDINCRIDSCGEEKYLFDWHQDYWFSVCSPDAVVIWIPVLGLSPDLGGLKIIDNKQTNGRILSSKGRTGEYNSYADAVILDEDISKFNPLAIESMSIGDVLCFKFNILHKSLPCISMNQSRFTVQLRFADFADVNFIAHKYKPGIVNSETIDYFIKE